MGIASAVTADTEHSACILPGSDMRTGGTLIQYQETDWNFLKRMASQLGLSLVPDTSYYYPRFYLGLPEGEKGNWEKSFPVISVLMGDIMQSVENALLIGKISFVMMLLRGQACRWGTGSHMKAGSCLFLGKNRTGRRGGHLYIPPCGKQLYVDSMGG